MKSIYFEMFMLETTSIDEEDRVCKKLHMNIKNQSLNKEKP